MRCIRTRLDSASPLDQSFSPAINNQRTNCAWHVLTQYAMAPWPYAMALSLLSACGGGSESSTQTSATPPAAQARSTQRPQIAGAPSVITVRARADLAGDIGPIMALRINGTTVAGMQVRSTVFRDYSFTVPSLPAGAKVDVAFTNDAMIGRADRNLYIQQITLNGTTVASDHTGVKYFLEDGRVLPGRIVMPWNGALRFTVGGTESPPASNPPIPPAKNQGGIPHPKTQGPKTPSGPIVARSGQVIEHLHITSASGPCIVVPSGVQHVVIRHNEIGPCGQGVEALGVSVQEGASDVTVQQNVIHHVAAGVYAQGARHPLIIDRNFVYNVQGPEPRGQMVQFNRVSGGTGQSRVTCNISDKAYGSGPQYYTDHINMFGTHGRAGAPIEIAHNRIRGGSVHYGSGIMTGDFGGSLIWIHDNVISTVANTGIGIAGGYGITAERNRIYNAGANAASLTGLVMALHNFSPEATGCSGHQIVHNRGISRSWVYGGVGELSPGFVDTGACTGNTIHSNNFADTSLSAADFDRDIAACQ